QPGNGRDGPVGWGVVTRLSRRSFPAEVVAALDAAVAAHAAERPLLACVAERAAEESGWAAINQANLARLRAGVGDVPLIELPFLFVEEFGAEQLAQLSDALEAALATPAVTVAGRPSWRCVMSGPATRPWCPTAVGGG